MAATAPKSRARGNSFGMFAVGLGNLRTVAQDVHRWGCNILHFRSWTERLSPPWLVVCGSAVLGAKNPQAAYKAMEAALSNQILTRHVKEAKWQISTISKTAKTLV